MAKYCWTHALWRRFGECPKCLQKRYRKELIRDYEKPGQVGYHPPPGTNWWDPLRHRMNQIITPATVHTLNQDCFGVCGMASAVYVLARDKSDRANELFDATFADLINPANPPQFATANYGNKKIKFRNIYRRFAYQQERADKEARNDPSLAPFRTPAYQGFIRTPNNTYLVDHCICRALGYLMNQTDKDRYLAEKSQFAAEFTPPGMDYKAATRFGSLPLRTNNVAFILKQILGAKNVEIAVKVPPDNPVDATWNVPPGREATPDSERAQTVAGVPAYRRFKTSAKLADEFARHPNLTTGNDFAVAGVFGDISYTTGGPSKRSPVQNLTFNHWVVIEGFHPKPATGETTINIWTWGRRWNVTIDDNVLLSFIQDVIFGKLS
jgi:hypothetical protein